MKKTILYIVCVLYVNVLFSQEPISIHLTEKDGVPGTDFYDVIEDDKGYLWFDGGKGLFRFDGDTYKNYQHKDQRGLSVFQVKKDVNNTIWYVNLSGQVFYIKNGVVFLFKDFKKEFDGNLPTLTCYKNQIIFFTNQKLLIYNTITKKEIFRYVNDKESHNGNLNIEPSIFKNKLYFGKINKIIQINLDNLKLKFIESATTTNDLLNASSITFLENKGILVIRERKDLKIYVLDADKVKKLNLTAHNLPNIKIVKTKIIKNQLWYCTENGIYICDFKNNELKVKRHLFPDIFITDVVVDKDQNYWFTSINKSIYVIPNIEINNINISLDNNAIITRTNLGKQDELLITTNKLELIKYDVSNKNIKQFHFKNDKKIYNSIYNPFKKEYIINTHLNTYLFDEKFRFKSKQLSSGTTKNLYFIDKDYFLVAASNYISIQDLQHHKKFSTSKRGYNVYYDKVNDLRYFSIIDGLFTLDKNLKKETILFNNKPIYVAAIQQTKDGVVWCISFKNGLFAIKNHQIIAHYTTKNGLLSNINSLIKADNNTLWIAGENGIQKMNTLQKTFQNITKKEGVVSYNYKGLELIDNQVYVSTSEQIISFDKNNVFKDFKTKEVSITAVTLNHKKQLLKNKYSFKYDASNIKFNFSAVGFSAKSMAKFQYRLKGLEKNWITTNLGENYVQYNALAAGNYTFQIKNITSNNEKVLIKEIHLRVTKPFWLEWWFYLVVLNMLFLFLLWLNNHSNQLKEEKVKRELKQLEIDNKLVSLKLENFRSQMNPHFIFNALNSIQEFIITNNKNLASDYLGKFADLIRTYLNQSTKNKISLLEEIDTLKHYLSIEKIRFEENLEYKINVTIDYDLSQIYIPTMLIQPYVENALKHGLLHKKEKGKLIINITETSNFIICRITDNGVGREKVKEIQSKQSRKHNSFALESNKNRLQLINHQKQNKITITINDLYDNLTPIGTEVLIKIPF